jgi:ComF family protein
MVKIFSYLLDFIYPPICLQCNRKISNSEYFCDECLDSIDHIGNTDLRTLCGKKFPDPYLVDSVVSMFYFRDNHVSQKIIHAIKYENMKNLGKKMGRLLGEKILSASVGADYILPVPLHKTKLRERGFNQSEVIAHGVSEVISKRVISDLLLRKKYTQTQTKLKLAERTQNVADAFEINKKFSDLLKDKTVFLLDDVMTTGSTIKACARLLKDNGVKKIIALSLAYVN